jgi:hypothetical protein
VGVKGIVLNLILFDYASHSSGQFFFGDCCGRWDISSMLKFNSESFLYSFLVFQFHFSPVNPIMVVFFLQI